MKVTPFLEEVVHLTCQFLKSLGYDSISQQLSTDYPLPAWLNEKNPLFKKGLIKIVKQYARQDPKISNYLQKRSPPQQNDASSEESNPKQNEKRKKSHQLLPQRKSPRITQSSWMSKFQKPKKLEEINHMNKTQKADQSKEKIIKKQQKQKQKIQSSEYESQNDSFQLEPKKKLKKVIKQEKKQYKQKAQEIKLNNLKQKQMLAKQKVIEQKQKNIPQVRQNQNGYKQSFSRINLSQIGPISEKLRDNSFHAKQKFGEVGDQWGEFGYQKLKDTRGDSFKKTKGKLKNRAFQGTFLDINKINSIRID